MTDTPDYPALVELASRLEGKDKKICNLALYCLKKQDKRIAKLQVDAGWADASDKVLLIEIEKRDSKINELKQIIIRQNRYIKELKLINAFENIARNVVAAEKKDV